MLLHHQRWNLVFYHKALENVTSDIAVQMTVTAAAATVCKARAAVTAAKKSHAATEVAGGNMTALHGSVTNKVFDAEEAAGDAVTKAEDALKAAIATSTLLKSNAQ